MIDDCEGTPEVILIASGSEVELNSEGQGRAGGRRERRYAWSPCRVWSFSREQSAEYRGGSPSEGRRKKKSPSKRFPISDGGKYVGLDGAYVCMKSFRASAPAAKAV